MYICDWPAMQLYSDWLHYITALFKPMQLYSEALGNTSG